MGFLDIFFPKECLECKKDGLYLCRSCVDLVLDGTFDMDNYSIFKYKGVIKKAIISIKYKLATDIANELIENCVQRLKSKKPHDIIVVPIPLYWQRQNYRGFNQSEILAQKLSDRLNWKCIPDLLLRSKKTRPQAELGRLERKNNLSGVFDINPNYINRNFLKKQKIIIFDDVYTTGSTINEAKKTLLRYGFKNIYSLTIAR